jgi:nucleotide-binding universal stress UspA family protein
MKIVALIDRSLYAQSVIDHAAWLAAHKGGSVDLIQIVSPNELMAAGMPPIHPGGPVVLNRDSTVDAQVADLKQKAAVQLAEARESLATRGILEVRTHVLEGIVPQLMAEAAADASIVVLGKRGENADLARLPLGSNFERLVRSSRTPVLAVSRGFRPIDKLLLAVDLDPAAASAIEAVASGVVPPMPATLLHVGEPTEAMQAELARAADRLSAAGYPATSSIVEGIPRFVVPERVVSELIGLVAMGAFGSSRLKSLIFGSLTTELIRACQVPILLCQ